MIAEKAQVGARIHARDRRAGDQPLPVFQGDQRLRRAQPALAHHDQRRLRSPMSPEELVRLAEDEASCEVFGLLKRPDEKWVTERAYDNPKFVEDLVRDIALRLMNEPRIARWTVKSENFESIHNHSAYAQICGENPMKRMAKKAATATERQGDDEPDGMSARQPADRCRRFGDLGPRHGLAAVAEAPGDPLRSGHTSAATPTPSM
jgi:hypothetical protein